MKKLSVLLFSIGLLGISFYGLSNNSYYIQLLMNLSTPLIYARIALVAVLLAYAFIPSVRLYVIKVMLAIGGILLLSLGLTTACSPMLLSHASSYTLIGDSLTLIEGGILAVVLSAELSARRSRYMARGFVYIHSLFAAQPRKLVYSPAPLPVRMLQTQFQFKPVLNGDRALPIFEGFMRARIALNKATPRM